MVDVANYCNVIVRVCSFDSPASFHLAVICTVSPLACIVRIGISLQVNVEPGCTVTGSFGPSKWYIVSPTG